MVTERPKWANLGGRPPGQTLTPKKARFVAEYVKGARARDAAIAAGYSAKSANHTAWRLLHHDTAVMAAVKDAHSELRERTQVTAESMMQQLAEDRQIAIAHKQPMAAVRASEIQAKLAGLLIERQDVRSVGHLKVEVVRFSDGGNL